MHIKAVEQRISHYLILFEGKELTRKQTIAKILHIQLSEGKVCDECRGKKLLKHTQASLKTIAAHLKMDIEEIGELWYDCLKCNGTGKLPPVTIEDAIKKGQEG